MPLEKRVGGSGPAGRAARWRKDEQKGNGGKDYHVEWNCAVAEKREEGRRRL